MVAPSNQLKMVRENPATKFSIFDIECPILILELEASAKDLVTCYADLPSDSTFQFVCNKSFVKNSPFEEQIGHFDEIQKIGTPTENWTQFVLRHVAYVLPWGMSCYVKSVSKC